MKKMNFGAIIVKDVEGKEQRVDVRKDMGNAMYMRGKDIVECELGRTIWHSDGDVELNDTQVAAVRRFTAAYPYVLRNAIDALLTGEGHVDE